MNFKFGHKLKTNREAKKLTTYDLAELVGVTNAYISKIENGDRTPSEKVLFNILLFIDNVEDVTNDVNKKSYSTSEILAGYSKIKNIPFQDLTKKFGKHKSAFFKSLEDDEEKLNKLLNHEVKMKKNSYSYDVLEAPYLDLKWLLTQREFEVFYGHDIDFTRLKGTENENVKKERSFSAIHKSILNDEDIMLIHKMIELILQSKYEDYDQEYYENILGIKDKTKK